MIKFWSIHQKNKVNIILTDEKNIYKGKIKPEELTHFSKNIEQGIISKDLFSIPFSYIKRIENQENKNDIKIFFGDSSEEELTSKDQAIKNEIFNHLKKVVPNMNYSKQLPSMFKYAKPQLFAILFTTGIFLWSLYYAIQIENGVVYELKGRAGLLSIIFSIGLLGVLKVVLLFSILIGIAVYSFIRKNKNRSEIEQLNR